MARTRTLTNVLEMRGAFKKNPQRRREDAETTGSIGNAPSYFSAEQLACWSEIIKNAPVDVLKNADSIAVEMAAVLLAEFRSFPSEFTGAKYTRLQSLLGNMGMTPADRSKVAGAGKKPNKNPFTDL